MFGSLISAPGANALLSKKRVWENFSTPSLTALEKPSPAPEGTRENRSSVYDLASGRHSFHTLDTYEGRNGEPATLHKYLYTHGNPVSFTDPSGNLSLSELSVSIYVRTTFAATNFATSYPRVVAGARLAVAAVSAVGFLADPQEASALALSTGNPAAAGLALADDVAYGLYAGARVLRQAASTTGRLNILRQVEPALIGASQRIESIASDAVVGFRGSLSTGQRFSTGEPFNPTDFDVDAFIVSDTLSRRIGGRNGSFRDGRNVPEVSSIADELEELFSTIPGHRSEPGKPFTFRVWTTQEFQERVATSRHEIFGNF